MSREEMRKLMEAVAPLDLDYDKIAKAALGNYQPKIRQLGSATSPKKQKLAVQQAKTKAGEPMVAFKEIMNNLFPNVRLVFYNDKQKTSRRVRAYIYPQGGTRVAYAKLMKGFRNNEDAYLQKISDLMTKKGYGVKKIKYEKPISGIGWYSSRAGDPNITVWIDPEY